MTRHIALASLLLLADACEQQPICEEDIRAQVLDEHVEVTIGERSFKAELADDPVERDRGWKHRRCDRVAILLVPDSPGASMPVWGCGLLEPIDAAFIADGQLVALEHIEPCAEPCAACSSFGDGLTVDAVLEVPAEKLAGLDLGSPTSF